ELLGGLEKLVRVRYIAFVKREVVGEHLLGEAGGSDQAGEVLRGVGGHLSLLARSAAGICLHMSFRPLTPRSPPGSSSRGSPRRARRAPAPSPPPSRARASPCRSSGGGCGRSRRGARRSA